jgi:hypothetical protein
MTPLSRKLLGGSFSKSADGRRWYGVMPLSIGAACALDYTKGSNAEIMVTLFFLQAAS